MIRLIHASTEHALADRVTADLRRAGLTVELGPGSDRTDFVLLVLGASSWTDADLRRQAEAALDAGQHIVIVSEGAVTPPKLIDHLRTVDYMQPGASSTLAEVLSTLRADDGRLALRVRTPSVQRSNRRVGAIFAAMALVMFAAGLYAVGVLGIQRPDDEFDQVETEVAATRDALAAPELAVYAGFLPRDAEAAAAVDYLPTLMAVPTVYRPLMAMTATAYAANAFQLVTATPPPATPEPTVTPGS